MTAKAYQMWRDNYGVEHEHFEEYVVDVLGWDADVLDKDDEGEYLDANTDRLYIAWSAGWSNGYDNRAHMDMSPNRPSPPHQTGGRS